MEQDVDRFKTLFDELYQPLCNHAYKYLGDRDESEDVVQETMIRFWELKKEMTSDSGAKYYLFIAVRNRSISQLRKKIKTSNVTIEALAECPADELTAATSEKKLEKYIKSAFEGLSPKCAQVFKLSRIQKMKYVEIAVLLSISVKTVENQMGKAIKHMRNFIHKNPYCSVFYILLLNN